tara:strand:- start:449 stop:835 length:387 start_codon:yes stop_codon:yes gene_type:complete
MNEPYRKTIKDGREIYIPNWAVDVALQNLSQAGKVFGNENVIRMAELNIPASVVALMSATDPALAARLIKHFVCQVRIDGSKIEPETLNDMFEGKLAVVMELFCHTMHSQFSDFFSLGLAKEVSPEQI